MLDLPSEQTLPQSAAASVGELENHFSEVGAVGMMLFKYPTGYEELLATAVRCTLCIEAFSLDPRARANQQTLLQSAWPAGCNHCFLFQLASSIDVFESSRCIFIQAQAAPPPPRFGRFLTMPLKKFAVVIAGYR
jgi:hypothetical protein